MEQPTDPRRASLDRAIEVLGGITAAATTWGMQRQAVHQWRLTRVPAEHCLIVERETRRAASERADPSLIVTCEELRPDLDWGVLRMKAAPASGEPEALAAA
jgi:DNA-binding transcriptional regulator YdaS (Cro superfamily)